MAVLGSTARTTSRPIASAMKWHRMEASSDADSATKMDFWPTSPGFSWTRTTPTMPSKASTRRST
eukprot:7268141-Prorocentrum_lima.AAC.1